MRRRTTILALSTAIASFGLVGSPTPANATHMCDPEIEGLCSHPENDLDDMIDLLCDKFVVVDKVLSKIGDCGTT